jgi:uncharacterized protein (DUF302 family)
MVNRDSGIVVLPDNSSVDRTVQKLEALLQARGVRLFAVIDHSGEAGRVGMHIPSTKLLIFGDPRAGTPIMIASPSAALDLPLKILVSEDAEGMVWISWNDPEYLRARHGFPHELLRNIAAAAVLAETAAAPGAGK